MRIERSNSALCMGTQYYDKKINYEQINAFSHCCDNWSLAECLRNKFRLFGALLTKLYEYD